MKSGKKNNLQLYLLSTLITLAIFFVYSFGLSTSFEYHPDFARDLVDMVKIVKGDATLLGPKTSFGGLFTGPYYYYLFAPALFLSGLNPLSVLYLNAFLFAASAGYLFKKIAENHGIAKALLGCLAVALSPLYIALARYMSNGAAYIPLLLMLLTYLYFNSSQKRSVITVAGFLLGVVVNTDFVALIPATGVIIFVFFTLPRKQAFLYFLLGFAASFLPLILFELTHNFVMIKNTFWEQSYRSWIQNTNIPGGITAKSNLFENIPFMLRQVSLYILLTPIIGLLVLTLMQIRKKLSKKSSILVGSCVVVFLLLVVLIRTQLAPHYIYPVALFMLFTSTVLLIETRWWSLVVVYLAINFIFFPKYVYRKSLRPPASYEKTVQYIINNKLVSRYESFNIIHIPKHTLPTVTGNEYRFFFLKYDYVPDSEFLYSASNKLVFISELPDFDIAKYSSWEKEQFGKEYFKNAVRYRAGATILYVIKKN